MLFLRLISISILVSPIVADQQVNNKTDKREEEETHENDNCKLLTTAFP